MRQCRCSGPHKGYSETLREGKYLRLSMQSLDRDVVNKSAGDMYRWTTGYAGEKFVPVIVKERTGRE